MRAAAAAEEQEEEEEEEDEDENVVNEGEPAVLEGLTVRINEL